MKRLTVQQAVFLAEKADHLFNRAASAWVAGNNSGNSAINARKSKQCDKLRREAVAMLAPFKIEVDFPGLYPSFKVKGFEHHSTLSAVSAALE